MPCNDDTKPSPRPLVLAVILTAFVATSLSPPGMGDDDNRNPQSKIGTPDNNVVFRGRCVDKEDGKPIQGATVRYYPKRQFSDTDILGHITTTDENGRFSITFEWDAKRRGEKIDYPGSELVVTAEGWQSLALVAGDASKEREIKLTQSRAIKGRVIDADGLAVVDAIVRFGPRSTPGYYDAVTDDDGAYVIDDLPAFEDLTDDPRSRVVTVSHPAFGHTSQKVTSIPATVDFQLNDAIVESRNKKITVVSQYGKHKMVGGVEMEISGHVFHGADVQTSAILRWPATESRPQLKYKVHVAADAFANREKWVMAWQQDRAILWIASSMQESPSIRAVEFSDPAAIVQMYQGRWSGQTKSTDSPAKEIDAARIRNLVGKETNRVLPTQFRLAMSRVFPSLRKSSKKEQTLRPSYISSASYDPQWEVVGTVRDSAGEPLRGVMVKATNPNSYARITSVSTDDDGKYKLQFESSVTDAFDRRIQIQPVLAGHFEKQLFLHGKIVLNPLSQPLDAETIVTLGKPQTIDFQLLPAAELDSKLPESVIERVRGGTIDLSWKGPSQHARGRQVQVQRVTDDIDAQGGFRLADIPTGIETDVRMKNANGESMHHFSLMFDGPGRHALTVINETSDLSKLEFLAKPATAPVQVRMVQSQKNLPPPKDETKFGDLVIRWAESCQGNNTLPIKDHDPNVWQKVIAGYNVVHVVYNPPRNAKVHTDDGFVEKSISEIAFQMYDMRPGAVFALAGDETLVLEDQLIEPSIEIVMHPAMKPYITKWSQLRIDAWNQKLPQEGGDTKLATISVAPGGVLSLDGNPLPKEIAKLGSELNQAGYHRDNTCVLIKTTPQTVYEDLHWPMWKLWSMRWKNVALRVVDHGDKKTN